MEINDYVRIKDGKIGKYIQPELGKPNITNGISFNEGANYGKHSKDIIDLVEVGDIVTVFSDLHDRDGNQTFNINNENHLKHLKNGFDNGYYHLINVLTKEQFESNAYKIEKER